MAFFAPVVEKIFKKRIVTKAWHLMVPVLGDGKGDRLETSEKVIISMI